MLWHWKNHGAEKLGTYFQCGSKNKQDTPGLLNSECNGDMETQSEVKDLKQDVRGCPTNTLFYGGITYTVKCMNLRCIFCWIFIYEHIHGSTSHIKIQNISNISKCSFMSLSINTFWEYGKGAGLEQAYNVVITLMSIIKN